MSTKPRLYVPKGDAPYNVIGIAPDYEINYTPLVLAEETLIPGDSITAILTDRTSAGYGCPFILENNEFITYVGQVCVDLADKRGPVHYVLFTNERMSEGIDGLVTYVCWAKIAAEGKTYLGYEIKNNLRVICPSGIVRKHHPKPTPVQQSILNAMIQNKWHDAHDLPSASGKTYQALIRRGWIECKKNRNSLLDSVYTPMIWNHVFRVIRK